MQHRDKICLQKIMKEIDIGYGFSASCRYFGRCSLISIDDYEATSKATEDLKILGQIYRKDMGEFLDFLADKNGKSFGRLCENNFDEILSWLK
ncbi:MAG: hypothetical protein ACI4FX_02025 [Agathobacter sp.]